MRRLVLVALAVVLLLSGCSQAANNNSVTFYYARKDIQYGTSDSVIVAETREIHEDNPDLHYLLSLYLKGPLDETLTLPVARNIRITEIKRNGNNLTVTFTSELSYLDNIELTLACACISQTCFSLTDAQTLRIEAPAVDYGTPISFTTTRNSFLLFDNTTTSPEADDAS